MHLEYGHHPVAGVRVAGPQYGGDDLPAFTVKYQQWVVDVLLEVAMVMALFLFPWVGSSVASKSKSTFAEAPSLPR